MPRRLAAAALFAAQAAAWGLLAYGFRRAARPPEARPARQALLPFSVVVAARDEEAVLPRLLDALAAQTHPAFEVVVVDDASTDATPRLVAERAARDARFRLVRVAAPRFPRKKHALTLGIAAARHAHLAFTDADCVPPPTWLSGLAAHAAAAPDALLVGYSPFRAAPGPVAAFARYETFVTAFLTAAAIGLGQPYMAVGRNMAYPKALFTRVGGFAHAQASLSGDDDLFVQEVARRRAAPVRAVLDPATFVPTDAPPTLRAFVRQKRRHLSAGRFYRRRHQVALALLQGSAVLLWLAPFWAGCLGALLLGARLGVQALALRAAARRLAACDLLPRLPAFEALHALYHALLAPLSVFARPRRWR